MVLVKNGQTNPISDFAKIFICNEIRLVLHRSPIIPSICELANGALPSHVLTKL